VPEVSVIIPVYNMEQFLEDCLNSVLAQTFTDFEIVIVNDGSTDRSAAIVEQIATKDNRFVILHQENKGLSKRAIQELKPLAEIG
jgi:glycosyltransferase involved in cell wall biosynthesis